MEERLPHNFITNYKQWLEYQEIVKFDSDEFHLVQEILSLQIALYLLRRTNIVDSSHIDCFYKIIFEKKTEYSRIMEKNYIDVNETIDF